MSEDGGARLVSHICLGGLLPADPRRDSSRTRCSANTAPFSWLSIVYCFGHFALALNDTRIGLVIGLGLIALGAGGIKPCVSANVGDQFGPAISTCSRVFTWFYFSINIGSVFATISCRFCWRTALRAQVGLRRTRYRDGHRDDRVLYGPQKIRPYSAGWPGQRSSANSKNLKC